MDTAPVIDYKSWDDQRKELGRAFTKDAIAIASRRELEHYMIVLANTVRTGDENYRRETDRFAEVVRHLLQIRISQELHGESSRISRRAVVVSLWSLLVAAAALVFSIFAWQHTVSASPPLSSQPQPPRTSKP